MKAVRVLTAALAAVLLSAAAPAQDAPAGPAPARRAPRARPDRAREMLERLTAELELSAEQQIQVKQVLETHQQAVQNWTKEHREEFKALREQMRKAAESGDREALKGLREKMQPLNKSRAELERNLQKQIAETLNEQQREKFRKMMLARQRAQTARANLLRLLARLDLTDQQKAQVGKIMDAAQAEARKVEDPAAKRKIIQDAMEKVRTTVLTEEQRARLARLQRRGGLAGRGLLEELGLTDGQKAKAAEIVDAARKQAKEAGDEKGREILRAAWQKVFNEVLTEQQRAKAKELREQRRKELQERRKKRQAEGTTAD